MTPVILLVFALALYLHAQQVESTAPPGLPLEAAGDRAGPGVDGWLLGAEPGPCQASLSLVKVQLCPEPPWLRASLCPPPSPASSCPCPLGPSACSSASSLPGFLLPCGS